MGFPILQAGRRNASGADIHALVRNILEHNTRVQSMRKEVAVHQARQALVREKVNEVAAAEATIDGLLTDLQVIASIRLCLASGVLHLGGGRALQKIFACGHALAALHAQHTFSPL